MVVTEVIHSSESPTHRFTEHAMTRFLSFLVSPWFQVSNNAMLKMCHRLGLSSPAEGIVEAEIREQVTYLGEDCEQE